MRIIWIIGAVIAVFIAIGAILKWLAFREMRRWIFIEAFMADEHFWDEKDFCRKVGYNLNLHIDAARSAFQIASLAEPCNCVMIAKVMLTFHNTGLNPSQDRTSEISFDQQILKLGVEEAKVKASILWDAQALARLKRPPLAEPPTEYDWVSYGF